MELIIASALFIIFAHTIFNVEGMIFHKIGLILEANIPEWFWKPLIGCPACMAPWWGTNIYIFAGKEMDFISWLLFICAVGGLSYILSMLIYWIKTATKYLEK